MGYLFIVVMAVGREHFHIDFRLKNAVNESVLFRQLPTPASLRLALQGLWMPQAGLRVCLQFLDEAIGLGKYFWLVLGKTQQVLFSLIEKIIL